MAYRENLFLNVTIGLISIGGGVGFLVLSDLHKVIKKAFYHIHPRRLSLHSQLALSTSTILIVAATLLIFIAEGDPLSPALFMTALFKSISAATTTGFNLLDITAVSNTTMLAILILMLIGAPAGGTGGGIKTTTFGILMLIPWALLHGNRTIIFGARRIPSRTIYKAVGVTLLTTLWITAATLVLTITERSPFIMILFEVVGAFATAGLSIGVTADLTTAGKIIIMLTMLIGRVGPLTVGLSLIRRSKSKQFDYPQGEVFIG